MEILPLGSFPDFPKFSGGKFPGGKFPGFPEILRGKVSRRKVSRTSRNSPGEIFPSGSFLKILLSYTVYVYEFMLTRILCITCYLYVSILIYNSLHGCIYILSYTCVYVTLPAEHYTLHKVWDTFPGQRDNVIDHKHNKQKKKFGRPSTLYM